MKKSPTIVVDKLLSIGAITKDQRDGALRHYNKYGEFIEESIIDTGALDEDALLKALTQLYHTRFVSTSKLKKADIGQRVLARLPGEVALKYHVFPILFDKDSNTLSIVTADPSDVEVEGEICRIARVSKVRSFVARPSAIKAAINKFYKGDIHAFATVDKEGIQAFQSMMDVYERNLLDEGAMVAAVASSAMSRERVLSFDEMQRSGEAASSGTEGIKSQGLLLGIVRVIISLLESNKGNLSGHSVLTSSHVEKMCRRIGLSEWNIGAITIAALLHDLGKGDLYHLTAFNVSEWEGHTTTAQKRFETPLRLFEGINLPPETISTIRHMYERVDGKGFPDGLKRGNIPLGARILAMADTFADLTMNTRNPFRKTLSTEEAMDVLNRNKQTIFDGDLTDLFGVVVAGDDIKRKLLTGAQTVLIVDSDAEQCAMFEMQLMARGFKVRTARTADAAIQTLISEPVNLIISEVDLKPYDGFEMKKRLNDDSRTNKIPLFYFTARAASADVEKGFELGAQDYLVKPSKIDVLAAKIQKFLEQAAPAKVTGGVTGSLKEMSIPDLVQILSHGRKSGMLKIVSGKRSGEVYFNSGNIMNAIFENLKGAEAFFAMLRFRDGTFSIDPTVITEEQVITMTSEMLLLEGLRRFDEENR